MNPMLCPIRVIKAMQYSLKGLLAIWQQEASFRQECLLVAVAICTATVLNVSFTKKILLIASVVLILIIEVINSAIETIVDRISKTDHPLSAQAKDMGSAAVLLTILLALFVWISILWNR